MFVEGSQPEAWVEAAEAAIRLESEKNEMQGLKPLQAGGEEWVEEIESVAVPAMAGFVGELPQGALLQRRLTTQRESLEESISAAT